LLRLSSGGRRALSRFLLRPPSLSLVLFRTDHSTGPGCVPGRNQEFPMATDIRLKEGLPEITEAIVATYTECSHINHLGHKPLPSREGAVEILADLLE